ncbi:hypothetical protein [Streptomyces morookaense]|uniref:Uncharacterized protein n=1 Tax=Streptomyces morookaense TaxID=1970 RepID=A0A7Y7B9K5_STRMO|nr:hypothetical protein [Streptomyces morookaense]NVK81547.1 hypothetical protein [Streptomyces morookaense]GHF55455.1 hypothetical protein GCM10010359_67150 [Streptomyces morookaense]
MALRYQDVMTTDLSPLLDVSEAWQKMGKRFGELKGDYEKNVQRALANGKWQGEAFAAHQDSSAATASEYAGAEKEALAVASLLRQAYTELTVLQKATKDLVAEAETKDFKVDSSGKATYVGFEKLSAQDRYALQHDPDYPTLAAQARQAAQEWTDTIARAVRAVDEADQGAKRALSRAATDPSAAVGALSGFNAHAEGDLMKAGAPEVAATKTDGWKTEGKITATGPALGFTVSDGPKSGKEGSAKAYADLFHVTAQGSATNGPLKLSGSADLYEGARASANYGFNEKGAVAKAEASVGQRAMAEGRAEYGQVGYYGRAEGFNGAEISLNAKATTEEFTVGGKAFAGKKTGITGGLEAAGIGIGATAEEWEGPGGEAWWGLKKDAETGAWKLGGKVGASPEAGAGVGLEITVDPHKLSKAADDVADAVGDAARSVKHTVSRWF